jgi:hypothetical protein
MPPPTIIDKAYLKGLKLFAAAGERTAAFFARNERVP